MSGLALLCPGQGGQHPAMFDLAAASEPGAAALARCAAVLGWDPLRRARAGGAEVYANAVAQPLVCAAEAATWEALRPVLPSPRAVLGYSLGELAAYACAGALATEEAAALAVARAAAMDAAAPAGAGLLALRGPWRARGGALVTEAGAEVAIVNGPDHVVVGGRAAALDALEARAPALGATAVRIPVSVPAHTGLLKDAVAPFAEALARSPLRDPTVPVLAGTTATPVRTRAEAVAALSAALASRIEWARCVAGAAELGCTVFLELGPGGALARIVARWVERSLGRR